MWRWLLVFGVAFCFANAESQEPFTSFSLDIEDGLARNTVSAINEDFQGRILIGTPGGLQCFNGSTLEYVEGIQEHVLDIFYAPDSVDYYVLTIKGIIRFSHEHPSVSRMDFDSPNFCQFDRWSDGKIRLQSVKKELLISRDLSSFTSHEISEKAAQELNVAGFDLRRTSHGLFHADSMITFSHEAKVNRVGHRQLFITTNEGVLHFHLDEDGNETVSRYWPNKRFQTSFVDRFGNLWIGTVSDGLWLVHRNTFHLDFKVTGNRENNAPAWTIIPAKESVLCATTLGLQEIQGNQHSDAVDATAGMLTLSGYASDSFLLIGSLRKGIFRFRNGKMERVYFNKDETLDNTVVHFEPLGDQIIALTKKSVVRFDLNGELVARQSLDSLGFSGYIMHLETNEDELLAATTHGVYRLNKDLSVVDHFTTRDALVFTATTTLKDTTWCSALQGGLFRLDHDSLISLQFPDKDLLSVANWRGEGLFIMSSTAAYLRRNGSVLKWSFRDGIPIREFNQGGLYIDATGKVFLSGVEGVASFYPDSLTPALPNPHIEWQVLNASSGFTEHITLSPTHDEMLLHVEPILPSRDHRFSFYVEFGDSLIHVEKETDLQLRASEGLEVQFRCIDNLTGKSIYPEFHHYFKVSIEQAFYRKWWFVVLIVITSLLFILTVYYAKRLRDQKREARKSAEQKKVAEERLRISRELHDNIGARLTHIISSIDLEMYRDQDQERRLAPINSFARETMGQLRETIWAVSDRSISLSEFESRLSRYIAQVAKTYNGVISLNASIKEDFDLSPTQTINLFRIIQEGINNAVKYSEGTEVMVNLDHDKSKIILRVSDNGSGFRDSDIQKGSGIKGMRERAKEINAEFDVQSSSDGSSLSIIFMAEE